MGFCISQRGTFSWLRRLWSVSFQVPRLGAVLLQINTLRINASQACWRCNWSWLSVAKKASVSFISNWEVSLYTKNIHPVHWQWKYTGWTHLMVNSKPVKQIQLLTECSACRESHLICTATCAESSYTYLTSAVETGTLDVCFIGVLSMCSCFVEDRVWFKWNAGGRGSPVVEAFFFLIHITSHLNQALVY